LALAGFSQRQMQIIIDDNSTSQGAFDPVSYLP